MPDPNTSPDPYAPVAAINARLEVFVRSLTLPGSLRDAIAYALLGHGKRLRPLLVWHACEAVGTPGTAALDACTSVELIHAFSLVHDDLPALDNDDLRRGMPTLHRHAGEAMAILAGDSMLALAFQCLVGSPRATELTRELAGGTMGMIAGQVYDTLGGLPENLDDEARVRLIHSNKTGALIRASVRMGGLVGGGSGGAFEALSRFGECAGLLFQISDDLLDVEGTAAQTGKQTGKDATAGKLTYPGVMGVEGARAEVARLLEQAREALSVLGPGGRSLEKLGADMAHRTR